MRKAWIVLAALLALTAAGCLGDEEDPEDDLQKTATVTEDAGGIEGIVTNAAVEAVPRAQVSLVERGLLEETAADGSFAFSEVPPGEHTVRIDKDGYLSAEQTVRVDAGRVESLDIVLAEEPDQTPYQHTVDMEGFIECGLGWRQEAASIGEPLLEDSALAACAVPNLYLPGNATNDRFLHTFELDPPLTEVVYELEWESSGTDATTPALRSILELEGFINNEHARIMDVRGSSPLRVELTPDDWTSLEGNITQQCEEAEDSAEDWCSLNPRSEGWVMVQRVFATGDCFDAPASTCVVFQQPFTHYVTAFYHQNAPSGYSVLDGG